MGNTYNKADLTLGEHEFMGQHEQDDLTTGMTLQMVQLNTLGQLERGHLERGVINVAPSGHCCKSTDMPGAWIPFAYMLSDPALCYTGLHPRL